MRESQGIGWKEETDGENRVKVVSYCYFLNESKEYVLTGEEKPLERFFDEVQKNWSNNKSCNKTSKSQNTYLVDLGERQGQKGSRGRWKKSLKCRQKWCPGVFSTVGSDHLGDERWSPQV